MAYDNGNIFARILRGEADAHVVLDEERCLAFMDAMPQSPGHTLVIPREPAANLFELGPASLAPLALAVQRVARAVRAAFEPPGLMVAQLNGRAAGQSVFHIHFHVIPRWPEREGAQPLAMHGRALADPKELATHAARIREALAAANP